MTSHDKEPLLNDCWGVVLAGGRSTRFGTEKAEVLWRGGTLLAHVAGRLRAVCPRVIAVARQEQAAADWPVDAVVHDAPAAPEGPLRGIVAGLCACRARYAFVAACDVPCLAPGLVRLLRAKARPDTLAVMPEWGGYPQPLTALYNTGFAAFLSERLAGGERSPRWLLDGQVGDAGGAGARPGGCIVVPEAELRRAEPQGLSFRNVNTPDDLAALDELFGCSER